MYLLHQVVTSYRTIPRRAGLKSFTSVYKMSADRCRTPRVNTIFYFLISKAGPSEVLLLNESPYVACFSSLAALV